MQGFNKYYPPDYDPNLKGGSLNAQRGTHALGVRAKKIDQGILVVRFELPFNIWCGGCGKHIGQGVRYNAEKKKTGNFYSTPIYSFTCKCHLCDARFVIRTDPQNTRYVVESGARAQATTADVLADTKDGEMHDGLLVLQHPSTSAAAAAEVDAFQKLEKVELQKQRALTEAERLSVLEAANETSWSDPYTLNSKLRAGFRKEKKVRVAAEQTAAGVKDRYGLGSRVAVEDLVRPLVGDEDVAWDEVLQERQRRARLEAARDGKRRREEVEIKETAEMKAERRQRERERERLPGGVLLNPLLPKEREKQSKPVPSKAKSRTAPGAKPESAAIKDLKARLLGKGRHPTAGAGFGGSFGAGEERLPDLGVRVAPAAKRARVGQSQ